MARAAPLPPNARLRWQVVKRIVAAAKPRTILEIGCGQGAFGARLARNAEYLGVEPDPESFAMAKQRIESAGGSILNIGAESIDSDRVFDLVCAFEVLEHLEDDGAALVSWRRHVRPGGSLLISTPAWQQRFNEWDRLVGHYRRYSPDSMSASLERAGFTEIDVSLYGWPLGYGLEAARGRVAAHRGHSGEGDADALSMRLRTARSGRLLQPTRVSGAIAQAATVPFAWLQTIRPQAGTGLVCVSRRR